MIEQFCRSILQIVSENTKALANLVMGLASQSSAKSVVEISLNSTYHYQHSSINKTIKGIDKPVKKEQKGSKDGTDTAMSRLDVEKKFAD